MTRIAAVFLAAACACGNANDPAQPADAGLPQFPDANLEPVVCGNLSDGPFVPEVFIDGLAAAEDIAFDGARGFVANGRGGLVRVDAAANTEPYETSRPLQFTAGMRFGPDGALYALEFIAGRLVRVDGSGAVKVLDETLQRPNAVYVTADGIVYFTETDGNRVAAWSSNSSGESIRTVAEKGAISAPNGIAVDERSGRIFVANGLGADAMTIARLTPGGGDATAIYTGPGNADGIALGECGHLYIVNNDRGASGTEPRTLLRLRLDGNGDPIGEPIALAEFSNSITNLAFGNAPGFSPRSLYVTGFDGIVSRVDVGVGAAPTASTGAH